MPISARNWDTQLGCAAPHQRDSYLDVVAVKLSTINNELVSTGGASTFNISGESKPIRCNFVARPFVNIIDKTVEISYSLGPNTDVYVSQ